MHRSFKLHTSNFKLFIMVPESKRRLTIGIIAVLLLAAALVLTFVMEDQNAMLKAACWRVGAVMGLLWAAYEDIVRLPKWFFPVILGCVVIIALKPKVALVLIPIFLVLAIIRPRRR
jgi:hypothetical protein